LIVPSALELLGNKVPTPDSPDDAKLEVIPGPDVLADYSIRFTAPEVTSLCPVTGQPDFAHVIIDYCPSDLLIESKALKLFLASFRNHKSFHEAVTCNILRRLVDAMNPKFIRVAAFWYPRGGIPIDVVMSWGHLPKQVQLLSIDNITYRGRG